MENTDGSHQRELSSTTQFSLVSLTPSEWGYRGEHLPYPNPTCTADIEIPPELKLSPRGDVFLLYNSGSDDENCFLMFETERNLRQLGRSKTWFGD